MVKLNNAAVDFNRLQSMVEKCVNNGVFGNEEKQEWLTFAKEEKRMFSAYDKVEKKVYKEGASLSHPKNRRELLGCITDLFMKIVDYL